MFGNWSNIGAGGGESFSIDQIYKYKGPLTFPGYPPPASPTDPSFSAVPLGEQNFYTYFAKIRRATDVTRQHLDLVNVSVSYDVPVEEIVGGKEWIPADDDETWAERKRELMIDNDVANAVIGRARRDVKLGFMYKFFQSLEMVTPYYGMPDEVEAARREEEEKQRQKQQSTSTVAAVDKMDLDGPFGPDSPSNDNGKRPASDEATGPAKKDRASPETDGDKKDEKFSMPERFRDDVVKYFVEPLCWNYGVRVYPPRLPPKVHLQRSKFSVHLNYHVHFTPLDPAESRTGLVDGPVLGIQVRNEHAFRSLSDPISALKKRRKKLMAAALAAKMPPTPEEEEARKKKEEKEKARAERRAKRRGTAPPKDDDSTASKEENPIEGEMKEELDDLADEGLLVTAPDGTPQDIVGITREIAALISMAQQRAKEKDAVVERKVRFRAIGKDDGSYWDDVYLVTSLHHHISISHLRVSTPYLRFLRTGKLPSPNHPFVKEGGWEKLHLRKTRYWSLMVPEERVEASRALAAVLKWRTRNVRPQ